MNSTFNPGIYQSGTNGESFSINSALRNATISPIRRHLDNKTFEILLADGCIRYDDIWKRLAKR